MGGTNQGDRDVIKTNAVLKEDENSNTSTKHFERMKDVDESIGRWNRQSRGKGFFLKVFAQLGTKAPQMLISIKILVIVVIFQDLVDQYLLFSKN